MPGNYVIVCDQGDGPARRTVFLGVFGDGVTRNSLAPDKRVSLLADHLTPTGGVIVDDNALFLPVLALTPLLGNSVRPGLWEDYLHPNAFDPPMAVSINQQLTRLYGFTYAQALRIVMHTHIVGRASGDSGTGGDARRKTLVQAYEALLAGAQTELSTGTRKREGSYPVDAVRTALNTQPDAARLNELHTLLLSL